MPKPSSSGTHQQSSNPMQAFFQRRKDRRAAKEDERAKEAINAAAKSEIDVINVLSGISFLHSKLPKAYLEHSSDPNDPDTRGDLEVARDRAIHTLKRATVTPKMDLSPIDGQLMEIAQRFKSAIEQGDLYAAYAAKGALNVGVDKIRTRVNAVPADNADNFIKKSADYLRDWCTLIDMCTAYDAEERSVSELTATVIGQEEEFEEQTKNFREKLENDDTYKAAYANILEHQTSADRLKWDRLSREIFDELIKRRVSKMNLALSHSFLAQKKSVHILNGGNMENMRTKLSALPDTTPVDLMNFYNKAMDEFAGDLAAMDVQISESMKALSDFEGRLKQLELGDGNQALMETASEQAEAVLKEWKQEQKDRLTAAQPGGSLMEEFGISYEKEFEAQLQELQAQREKQEQREQEILRQQDRQIQYN